MNSNELREKFLNFFQERGHRIVPSDSLIPSGDPSLLFTSAGMVQFKKHFLGQTKLTFKRACSSQKCLRTTDIEKVGWTSRHLTFFEMLGNFSFGDYFKSEAIEWGWEFLTKECQLDPKLLYASIYREDEESFALWKKILPEARIVRLGEESNFWNMGETGPCGPCSEILFDQGETACEPEKYECCKKNHCKPGCDCDRYLEVWNLVFTQYDKQANGTLLPLPQKNIDTGMGLERLTAVVNGFSSSFEIDIFQNLIQEIKKLLKNKMERKERDERTIADHLRACTFLICDGVLPSNEGRGYILRRLARRALRIGWLRGLKEPFLYKLVPAVVANMNNIYPELLERMKNIQSILETEENNALATIESGMRTLQDALGGGKKLSGKVRLAGEKIFYIYDTFGLDKEIQKEIVKDWGAELIFSEEEFEKAKAEAQEISRKGWKGSGETDIAVYAEVQKKLKPTLFRGYELLELETEVTAILKPSLEFSELRLERSPSDSSFSKGGNRRLEVQLNEGEEGEIVLAETPFYAESGGQVGDRGSIESIVHSPQSMVSASKGLDSSLLATGYSLLAEVLDTQEPVEGLIVHKVKVKSGKLKVREKVFAKVNAELRRHTMRHHTATHLLHAALRKILGTQVTQAGSLVAPEKLRFDFTYPKALSEEQLSRIELEVNRAILENLPRKRNECSLEEARSRGALAFFGDKYGEKVFVVNYGSASTEVCGGTHCNATGEIGLFKIVSESSVGSGVRRIEALAGEKALAFLKEQEKFEKLVSEKLRCSFPESPDKIEKLLAKQKELEREIATLRKRGVSGPENLISKAKTISWKDRPNGEIHPVESSKGGTAEPPFHRVKLLAEVVEAVDSKSLRETADRLQEKLGPSIVLLTAEKEGKISFVVRVTKEIVKNGFNAAQIAKRFSEKIGGKAGGKEILAEGGAKAVPNLREILSSFQEEMMESLQTNPVVPNR